MKKYAWAVIGAGPAGIAAVGKLLDHGVEGHEIVWIDPAFAVGDFGALWANVPSNTKVDLFEKFLQACKAFSYDNCDQTFALHGLAKEETCRLGLMADPLRWVTQQLKSKVDTRLGVVKKLELKDHQWHLLLNDNHLTATKVILAIGADPKSLHYPAVKEISLKNAIDHDRLSEHVHAADTVAVFGSSHSAILVLKNLIAHGVEKVINFYRSPLLFATPFEEGILFDDGGLKGDAARWARENLHGALPLGLSRYYASEENIKQYLPGCSKAVYAVGFKRRHSIVVEGIEEMTYHHQVGIIAPGLFGFGIAFPEAKENPWGIVEFRVGLWKFMDYLQRIMPVWLKYSV